MTLAQIWDRLPNVVRLRLYLLDKRANGWLKGNPNETISSRLARARDAGNPLGIKGCQILDSYDPGHCDRARIK